MKSFKLLGKKITLINSILVVFCLFAFQGCEDKAATCTGCPVGTPYSKPGSTANCYATLADCQAALGSGCVYCN